MTRQCDGMMLSTVSFDGSQAAGGVELLLPESSPAPPVAVSDQRFTYSISSTSSLWVPSSNVAFAPNSMREADRLKVLQAVLDRMIRVETAAERIGITTRQLERLLIRYQEEGPAGLTSRKRGKPSNHQLPAGLANHAMEIVRDRYSDFGPTLAREKLIERHGITLGLETVRRLMVAAPVEATSPTRSADPPTAQPPSLRRRADPDRWQRSRLVRGSGRGLHAAGLHR